MPLLHDWLLDAVAERGTGTTGNATAVVYRDTYLSWRGLAHRVDRRSRELEGLGIGAGSWVGVMLGNVPEFVIIALALSKLKAVMVPIDPTTANRELDMVFEAAPMRALITRPGGADLPPNSLASLSAAVRASRKAFQSKFTPESRRRLQGTLLTCSLYNRDARPAVKGAEPASVVLFTADAGGDPKGVIRTDRQLAAVASSLRETLALKAEDHTLCVVPLHHGYGFDFGLVTALACKSTLFLEDEISPKILNRLIRDNGVTFFPGTPGMFASLARVAAVKPLPIKAARFVSSGSPLAPTVADTFHQRFGVRLLSCYHTTETGPVALDRAGKDAATVGKALGGVDLQVATAPGIAVPAGTQGPVWVRSGQVSTTWVPDLPSSLRSTGVMVGRASPDGWFRTGDLGALDRSGRLTLGGREDDLVKVNGKRVALGEVEGCLEGFAKVRAAQARVVLDELGGPMVVARVVRDGTCRAEELIDHCARNLAPYKVPRQIEFCEHLG